MEYPKRVMRASEMAKFTGIQKRYFSDLVHLPKQNFAYRLNANIPNSPVMIDTAEYEKWRKRQVELSK